MGTSFVDRIESAEATLKKLESEMKKVTDRKRALEQKVSAREGGRRRKVETQVKVLLGAAALKLIQSDADLLDRLLAQLNERDAGRVGIALDELEGKKISREAVKEIGKALDALPAPSKRGER